MPSTFSLTALCVLKTSLSFPITTRTFSPLGKLTESRSNIVSNNSLACAVVEHQIHPYILHSSPTTEDAVACITCIQDRTNSYSEQLEVSCIRSCLLSIFLNTLVCRWRSRFYLIAFSRFILEHILSPKTSDSSSFLPVYSLLG